jgi:hypothetical protein
MLNAGDGTFLPPAPVDLGVASAGSVRAADLDGDQDIDLAIGDCGVFPGSDLVIAVNDGTGAFSVLSRSSTGRNCSVGTVTSPDGLALLDVDADGAADAVLPSLVDDDVRVLLNGGDLTFEPSLAPAVGDQPLAVAVGDLDGDGRPDIVTADKGLGSPATVSVLINQTPVADCPADTNADGVVDVDDLTAVILDWNSDGSAHGGDVDGSGTVDVDDLTTVILAWGTCG